MLNQHSQLEGKPWSVPGPDEDYKFPEFPPGLVWLIGAGPGDPGLMTIHALNAVRRADVVVHDSLVSPRILGWCHSQAQIVHSGKRGGRPSPQQADITLKLIEYSRQGKRVARLKGGDPFVFGRGGEEVLALLKEGVPVRATPGVTAGIGGLASVGIPLTYRETNQSVTFLTGHDQAGGAPRAVDWRSLAMGSQFIVLYMAMKNLGEICHKLMASGRDPDDPVAIVVNATLPQEQALETTLQRAVEDVAKFKLKAPAVICIGRNVLLRRHIDLLAHSPAQMGEGENAVNRTASSWIES